MVFTIDKDCVTFHCNKFYIKQYIRQLRKQRAIELSKLLEKGVRGKRCPYVEGLWCWNEGCYGPKCMYVTLILGQLEDRRWGCWGFYWANGNHLKGKDTDDMRKFWRQNTGAHR